MFLLALILGNGICLLSAHELWARGASAGNAEVLLTADSLHDYARDRFNAGDYETAIFEFKRFVYFFPDHARTDGALFHIGQSYFSLGRYDAALSYYEKTVDGFPDSKFALQSRFQISRCYFRMNDPDAAMQTLYQLSKTSRKQAVKDKAFYRLAWLSLKDGRIGQARSWLDRISPAGRRTHSVTKLLAQIDELNALPRKSPFLAGVLSIIPGGGYLYCGRYQDAFIAFGLNAALMGAAYESFDNDLEVLGGVITLVDLGFYVGSIYGGIASAHKYNRAAYNQYIADIKAERFSLGISDRADTPGLLLSFTYRW